ncbi:MAG TPA: substrate-binding domain-containing protein, partial [Bacillales bacterium]|nr:substrate-binding domain-containing protein [Bacillales bacterium]
GKQFLPYARRLLATHDDGLQQLVRWQQGYERKLTLAVSPLIAASRLPYWIRDYTKHHPQTEVIVQVAESSEISARVEKNDADLGLSLMKSVQPGISCEKLFEDPMLCVAPHDGGDMESSPPLDFEALVADQLLFTHNHPVFWDDLLTELRRRGLPHRTMVVSQVHVTKRFIEEGLGFSFLPKSAVQRELLEGRMLEVDVRGFENPPAATYVICGPQHEEAQKFRAFLREHFGG